MMVICVDDSGSDSITRGRVYKRLPDDKDWKSGFYITNDRGVCMFYWKWRFIPLDEYRESQIKKLYDY